MGAIEFLAYSSLTFAFVFNDAVTFCYSLEASDMEFQELPYAIRTVIITVRSLSDELFNQVPESVVFKIWMNIV